jgi:hypothetical protein
LDWVPGIKSIVGMQGLAAYYDTLVPSSITTATGVKLWGDLSGNSGVNCLRLNGALNNFATTPNQITFDPILLDVRTFVSADVWASAGNFTFVDHLRYNGSAFTGWSFGLTTASGRFFLLEYIGGAGSQSTVATGDVPALASMTGYWIRATRDGNAGVITFYYALGSPQVMPSSWTLIKQFTGRPTGAIDTSTALLTIGASQNGGGDLIAGNVFYADIRNNLNDDGTGILAKADFTAQTKLATSFVSSTGETWTVNSTGATGARISGARDLYQGTAAAQPIYTPQAGSVLPYITFDGISQFLKTAPFPLNQPTWVVLVGQPLSWTSTDVVFDGNASNSGALIQTTSTPQVNITAGSSVGANTGWTVGADGICYAIFDGASSSLGVNRLAATTGNAGAANMGGFTLGSAGTAGSYGNILVRGAYLFSIHPTQAVIDQVLRFASRRYSIAI